MSVENVIFGNIRTKLVKFPYNLILCEYIYGYTTKFHLQSKRTWLYD